MRNPFSDPELVQQLTLLTGEAEHLCQTLSHILDRLDTLYSRLDQGANSLERIDGRIDRLEQLVARDLTTPAANPR